MLIVICPIIFAVIYFAIKVYFLKRKSFKRHSTTLGRNASSPGVYDDNSNQDNHPDGLPAKSFEYVKGATPFQMMLAETVDAGKPIPAGMALQWYGLIPQATLKSPYYHCVKEFQYLFAQRYKQKYGDGIIVAPDKSGLKLTIQDLSNPLVLKGPMDKIGSIIDACTHELAPYNRYIEQKENDPESLTALSLMPKALLNYTSGAKIISDRLTKICSNDAKLLSLNAFYKIIGQPFPARLPEKESERLAVFMEKLGFGIAPDVRYHNIKLALNGNIAVFAQGHGDDFRPSKQFCSLVSMLELVTMIAQVAKKIAPALEKTLNKLVLESQKLTNPEKTSLLAFLDWGLQASQNPAGLKTRLAKISDIEKTAIKRILASAAHANGHMSPKKNILLENLYVVLGLNREKPVENTDTVAAKKGIDTTGAKDPDASFAVFQPVTSAQTGQKFELNETLIKIRQKETTQVKHVLEEIFSDRKEYESNVNLNKPKVSDNPLLLLDEPHQKLFNQLVARKSWERTALQNICKRLGLMVDGAMEVLNEWAFEHADAPLIDDGEPIYVDISLAKEIVNVQ